MKEFPNLTRIRITVTRRGLARSGARCRVPFTTWEYMNAEVMRETCRTILSRDARNGKSR